MNQIIVFASGVVFIFYGLLCLITNHMKVEFERYQLARFRRTIGVLELLGGIGLLGGFYYPFLLIIASAGLTLLMLLGTLIRIKTKDPVWEIIPAFSLMLLNCYILSRVIYSII
ncbi:MAG: DoxX family protein [Bacteriovorax sp.]|nr:DoxX family protein [Bacteriovorax sp.]